MVVGEIIDVSFTQLTCEAKDLNNVPTPGKFIKFHLDDYTVIGCVIRYDIGSISEGGYPRALWKSPEEIKSQYPQIDQILKAYFKCVVLGYIVEDKYVGCLPDRSIRLHSLVEPANEREILLATQNGLFLNSVLKTKDVDIAEVVPWMLFFAYIARGKDYHYLEQMGKALNAYLKYDLNLLEPIIERLENLIMTVQER
ncbi:hypothetical protein Calow_0952 [Caldicellulosiruptor owensensis OL]|uniref:Uncharacterized protein n=2 Tax=Caldicellulosiruptor owensensis TaxID=55205 RepID=E4Q6T5_CALOW|nr:hypothetical protein [Caldicellulosiruptor owensensis]ADQ04518.1 hypothetical protein Calow_0952 [Caldicellulosiruptor owensensis OL]